MKIILSRDGIEKKRENTGRTFNDEAAIKFLASLVESEKSELRKAN